MKVKNDIESSFKNIRREHKIKKHQIRNFKISLVRDETLQPMVDALGPGGDEGRGVPAISLGEVASNL